MNILKAQYENHPLQIADKEIPCAVLENGERVLSLRGVERTLGRGSKGKNHSPGKLPVFLSPNNLKPFIDEELLVTASTPIIYQPKKGGRAHGFPAKILPKICEVWLKARDDGALTPAQMGTAQQAEVLIRAFAHVGIIALVDEATGYQDKRVKDALNKILNEFLVKEAKKYEVTFPTDFYKIIFKLNNWTWTPQSAQKKPMAIAKWTNDLVYERLAPGLLEELKIRNPKTNGRREHKHFQFLSDTIGKPRLLEHFGGLIALGRVATNWRKYKEMVERAYPKSGENLMLDLDYGD